MEAAEVLAALGTDAERGLSSAEAAARLARYGCNELEAEKRVPPWRRLVGQFRDPLVILLLVATGISAAVWGFEREQSLPYESLAILAIVIINAVMGFVQESRAESALAALRTMYAAEATVIRDGERRRIPAAELAPGDIVLVEEGDTVPADARLLRTAGLRVAEAALTGESLPVHKGTAPVAADAALGDRDNMIFSGTAVAAGRGAAVVTATGMATEMGRIAGMLTATADQETPLQRELRRTGRLLGAVVIGIAVVMIATTLLVEEVSGLGALIDVLIMGVALAVAAVPEGLPAVTTAVLALGVQRMARRRAIVRRLAAVETLGAATVIASDKTGTLTRNEMTVRAVVTASGRVTLTGTGYAPEGEILAEPGGGGVSGALREELRRVLIAADLASNATVRQVNGRWVVQGDPTEGALVVAARKAGVTDESLEERFERAGEVPFSSERKMMSTLQKDAGRVLVFTKGAPDVVLARCTAEAVGEGPFRARPLTEERRREILATSDELAGRAMRTLAVAARVLPAAEVEGEEPDESVEHELVFLGLIGMIDPPREEAKAAVAWAKAAGVRPVMITGDHPRTAAVIAAELGIADRDARVLTGAELSRMSNKELAGVARDVAVYARVAPEHKLRIVRALRRSGEVVAMNGDGVNDAPALRAADIGVAMGLTGTDVTKGAADIVLADDNFATIVAAVEEGRAIFANIRRFLRFLLSSNIGEVMTMFFGVVLAEMIGLRGAGDGASVALPLLATHLLWINLVTDGAPALALGVEPADQELMRRPPRPPREHVITGRMWAGIVFVGAVMAAGTLLVLDASLPGGLLAPISEQAGLPYAHTMAFTTLVMFQLFNALNARAGDESALRGLFRNRWLWAAIGAAVVLHAAVVYVPLLQKAFATTPLGVWDWVVCTAVASSVVWLREVARLVFPARAPHSAGRLKVL